MEFSHKSVLLRETVDLLNVRPGGIFLDGTVGLIVVGRENTVILPF